MTDEDNDDFTISDEEWNRLGEGKGWEWKESSRTEAGRKYGHGGRDGVDDIGNGKDKDKDKKQPHYVQKYTEEDLIAEAVIVGSIPYFALAKKKKDSRDITLAKLNIDRR